MSKEDLARLELELREQLKRYRKLQENTSSSADTLDSSDDQKIMVAQLPLITTKKELIKLRVRDIFQLICNRISKKV